jgi:hypothetical protein
MMERGMVMVRGRKWGIGWRRRRGRREVDGG